MEIEESSSLEVTDSDNNSIKESVKFSEPSFRTNLSYFFTFTSESELQKKRERESFFVVHFLYFLCVKNERKERYSALGRAESYFGVRTVATVRSEPLQGSFQTGTHIL